MQDLHYDFGSRNRGWMFNKSENISTPSKRNEKKRPAPRELPP